MRALRLRLNGQWKQSIDTLTGLITDPGITNQEEVVYVLGLIYESMALFPEAMGHYDMLQFSRDENTRRVLL